MSERDQIVKALQSVRPQLERWQNDHCAAHGHRSPRLDGLMMAIDSITEGPPLDETAPAWCDVYDDWCLHDGEECGECCAREVKAAEDSDDDRGDWQCHQRRC